jgi:hypothetical protein
VVAGKNQYKHASVAMFDGYAGSSASGFRQEIEQERALGQLDDIVAHYEAHVQGERQAGHAAGRLAAEYDRICNELGPLPGRIADKGRIKAMLAHLARTLHVGHLNDCFFEPATAYCLEKVRMDARMRRSCRNAPRTGALTPASPGVICRSGKPRSQKPKRCCVTSVCPGSSVKPS